MRLKVLSCNREESGYFTQIEYLDNPTFQDKLYINGKGGAIGDLGTIGEALIIEVKESGIVIDRELGVGEYPYIIHSERRLDVMENHSGEHLLSAVAYLKYGWQTKGFRMSEEYSTLDFDVENVSEETIAQLEREINQKIQESYPLEERLCNREEAQELLGARKDLPSKIEGDVRVLSSFPGDVNPCAGIHVDNTLKIKMFKILSVERVKGGMSRFYFISGNRVLRDYTLKHNIVRELNKKFSSENSNLVTMIDKQLDEKREIKKELIRVSEVLATYILKETLTNLQDINGRKIGAISESREILDPLKREFFTKNIMETILLLNNGSNFSIVSNEYPVNTILKKLGEIIKVKGGGSPKEVTFFCENNIEELLKHIIDIMKTL